MEQFPVFAVADRFSDIILWSSQKDICSNVPLIVNILRLCYVLLSLLYRVGHKSKPYTDLSTNRINPLKGRDVSWLHLAIQV